MKHNGDIFLYILTAASWIGIISLFISAIRRSQKIKNGRNDKN